MKNVKSLLYQQCVNLIDKRKQTVDKQILDIEENLRSETKSSAGDKYETGRAMLQLEREKAGRQLAEIENLKEALSRIELDHNSSQIRMGSLVYTSNANYFLSVSLGLIQLEGFSAYAISSQTPIGMLLMGKTVEDTITFNGNSFTIKTIV